MKFEFPFSDPHHSGNLARQLLDALQEAQDFDQFEANWALKQHVEETKNLLRQMIRTARSQSFTSLMADLSQDINRVYSFSRCPNGAFP